VSKDVVPLRLGTRGSTLARWQADWVAAQLEASGVSVRQVLVTTQGDGSDRPLYAIGGRGVFTKETQRDLLENEVDVAVHSLKDLPTDPVPGLTLAAVPQRASAGDALVSRSGNPLDDLPEAARIGTGSTRRRSQLLHHRPDLEIDDIRGNLETRLRKLDEGQFDAIVLAEAGLDRLGLQARVTQILPRNVMLPAVGQGALGIEIRVEDQAALEAVDSLNHAPTRSAVLAERALLAGLRAGCLAPVGAWGRIEEGRLKLDAAVLSPDGRQRIDVTVEGDPQDPERLGRTAAEDLLSRGAEALIAAIRHPPD
jgi:hydroxymethylbilane synthase